MHCSAVQSRLASIVSECAFHAELLRDAEFVAVALLRTQQINVIVELHQAKDVCSLTRNCVLTITLLPSRLCNLYARRTTIGVCFVAMTGGIGVPCQK